MSGLLTDLYELTMAAGYAAAGRLDDRAVFEFSIRRLPRNRGYVVVAGIEQAAAYLENLCFSAEEIAWLRKLPQFARAPEVYFDWLRDFRFRGDVDAVQEGTVLFAGEPVLTVRAALGEAQIPETALLATVTFQTLVATKAARLVDAAAGRAVVEFGTRRAHTPDAGVLGARAAYIGGCFGTSNALAGYRFRLPVFGTAAHSWMLAFPSEGDAFHALQNLLGPHTVQLVDTYDTLEGVRLAASLGRPLWGIRLDSGDFAELAVAARRILDEAGLKDVRIMVSGDLDEWKIRDLVSAGAPVDSFGVGTELATSGDAPSMGSIYKLVEIESGGRRRPTAKSSQEKKSLPGAKQIFRFPDHDVIGLAEEPCPKGAAPLLHPLLRDGRRVAHPPPLDIVRMACREGVAKLPAPYRAFDQAAVYPVQHSPALQRLTDETLRRRQ